MEPPLSVGSSEIEGNCDDQFKLDEFLRMVLITAAPIFFLIVFVWQFELFIAALFFCHVSKCVLSFFCEWRVLLEELTAARGSG